MTNGQRVVIGGCAALGLLCILLAEVTRALALRQGNRVLNAMQGRAR